MIERWLIVIIAWLGLALGGAGFPAPTQAKPPTGEEEARRVALDFIKAFDDRSVDDMLRLSTLPWHFDFTITYETQEDLKNHLLLSARPTLKGQVFTKTIQFVQKYADFGPKIGKPYYRKQLDKLLSKDDFVVAVQRPKDPKSSVYLFVRIKDGKASICGYAGD